MEPQAERHDGRPALGVPEWLAEAEADVAALPDPLERAELVCGLADRNVRERTGGPFGAAVVELSSGRVIATGVNRVVPDNLSIAHAEMVALARAQRALGTWDLASGPGAEYELTVSWQPCAMCTGALVWAGVSSLAVAGIGPEPLLIAGFDEGPVHPHWVAELAERRIRVSEELCPERAVGAFYRYVATGGPTYNSRRIDGRPPAGYGDRLGAVLGSRAPALGDAEILELLTRARAHLRGALGSPLDEQAQDERILLVYDALLIRWASAQQVPCAMVDERLRAPERARLEAIALAQS